MIMVKRYTIDDDGADMFEDDSGAYVTYADYELMSRNATETLDMLEHAHNDRDLWKDNCLTSRLNLNNLTATLGHLQSALDWVLDGSTDSTPPADIAATIQEARMRIYETSHGISCSHPAEWRTRNICGICLRQL